MISKKTAHEILVTLQDWASDNSVPWEAIDDLVHQLNSCQGNQSYRDTMRSLELLVRSKVEDK